MSNGYGADDVDDDDNDDDGDDKHDTGTSTRTQEEEKDTNCTARWVAVSGLCDSLSSVRICLSPSSCGCHAIFIVCFSTALLTNKRLTSLLDLADKRKLPTVPLPTSLAIYLVLPPLHGSARVSCEPPDSQGRSSARGRHTLRAPIYICSFVYFFDIFQSIPLSSASPFFYLSISPFSQSLLCFSSECDSLGRCGAQCFLTGIRVRRALSCSGRFPQRKAQRWPMATHIDRIAFSHVLDVAFIAVTTRYPRTHSRNSAKPDRGPVVRTDAPLNRIGGSNTVSDVPRATCGSVAHYCFCGNFESSSNLTPYNQTSIYTM